MATTTRPRTEYRAKADTEPPAPLTTSGRCRFAGLVERLTPRRQRRHRTFTPCYAPASRRVQVGLDERADVCLWHSLVAQEHLHAHLVRDLTFS